MKKIAASVIVLVSCACIVGGLVAMQPLVALGGFVVLFVSSWFIEAQFEA